MSSPSSLEYLRNADPLDHVAALARADAHEEAGDMPRSHLERGRAWLLAWAASTPGSLSRIAGKGNGWKRAYFTRGGKGVSPIVIAFRADAYDVPADWGQGRTVEARAGTYPWLQHGRETPVEIGEALLPSVRSGASVAEFVRAVILARGHWLPIEV